MHYHVQLEMKSLQHRSEHIISEGSASIFSQY
jgi:hypothetical protein